MIRYLLDTDIVSSLYRATAPLSLIRRLENVPAETCFVSSVTIGEMLGGAMALVRKEESLSYGTRGHALLTTLVSHFRQYQILLYDDDAKVIFEGMSAAVKRNGRADCEIAATALHNGLTVVTRNLRHFRAIPDVVCEDWAN